MRIAQAKANLDSSDSQKLDELEVFAKWLLDIGDGRDQTTDELSTIAVPESLCLPSGANLSDLAAWVYPDMAQNCKDPNWLSQRAILAPYNADVDAANDALSAEFPGAATTLLSADSVSNSEDSHLAPAETLNGFQPTGLPSHKLELKPNMPLMLLRNMSPSEGLCNGTRLIFMRMIGAGKTIMQARIANGPKQGNVVLIPRIKLSPDEGSFPYEWSRLQFPVRVAFAMTINKAQGQTLTRVGVFLENPCFSHGQFYVAASRVGLPESIRFAIDADEYGVRRTANIVYPEALTA